MFDHTMLVDLFAGHTGIFDLWRRVERGERALVLPAAAVAEANHLIGADHNAWTPVLYPAGVSVAPLGSAQAIDTGRRGGTLTARHVVFEAQAVAGIIVTRAPWQYRSSDGPMRIV